MAMRNLSTLPDFFIVLSLSGKFFPSISACRNPADLLAQIEPLLQSLPYFLVPICKQLGVLLKQQNRILIGWFR